MSIPDQLPVIEAGRHTIADGRMNAMEAAAWLAGEELSERPRSVHPVIARLAMTATHDGGDTTEGVWSLVIASVGTARPRRPLHTWRLARCARRHLVANPDDWRGAWEAALEVHARRTGRHRAKRPLAPLAAVARRVRSAATSQSDTPWAGTLSYSASPLSAFRDIRGRTVP
jgi:hypothetical protein